MTARHATISDQTIQPACKHRQSQGEPLELLPRVDSVVTGEAEGVWSQSGQMVQCKAGRVEN